uniref:Uncharacterized protein n=1 Tax=Oryza brachyantha TaxID=4533 RepID=J3LD86_ORYBR
MALFTMFITIAHLFVFVDHSERILPLKKTHKLKINMKSFVKNLEYITKISISLALKKDRHITRTIIPDQIKFIKKIQKAISNMHMDWVLWAWMLEIKITTYNLQRVPN